MNADFDVAIIGSGFSGSLLAMIARRLGRSVILLERGRHPRFAIGESSTPLANLLLEELAVRYDLPRLLPLTKWGAWQRSYPELSCGLKRGFTFYHHTFDAPWSDDAERRHQLLVAASPHDGVADTHWYRPDFDHFLVREAQAAGAEYLDQVTLRAAETGAQTMLLRGEREGRGLLVRARLVVDASGPRGFLHRALGLSEAAFDHLPRTETLYAHFRGVGRVNDLRAGPETPPYPVDDAALHHVFAGGWIWVLRFNNGLTSAGVAATSAVAAELGLAEGGGAWERLLRRLPMVREQFEGATAGTPFVHLPRLAFRSGAVAGDGWVLLPSAAGFVDPLLSTGFPLTLLGVARLAEVIAGDWETPRFGARLERYAARTSQELAAAGQLVAALYASMGDFPVFASLSLLYFAAASFTETARRLGRPELAGPAFLLAAHPQFGPELQACCAEALRLFQGRTPSGDEREQLMRRVYKAIAPVDVAGLGNLNRRNWHPVVAGDLFAAAGKLNATAEEIERLCRRCGLRR